MEGRRAYDVSHETLLLQNEKLPSSSEVLESLWISSSSPSFHGSTSMVNFENSPGENTRGRPFFNSLDKEENADEDYDRCLHQPEKKRRLTVDQLEFLERSFEVENKLEPERKVQLAKELGLQPRQVAIWFQNRRARYKTKQLEKDYDSLKASYDKLKAEYDGLLKEGEKLKNEVHLCNEKLLLKERGKSKPEPCDPIDLDSEPQPIPKTSTQNVTTATMVICKQEDANSTKSDVFDSDSSHYTDGNPSSLLEPTDSSHAIEPDQSDFSQDEEDNLSINLNPLPCFFPKLQDECCNDSIANSCNFGYLVEDHALWF